MEMALVLKKGVRIHELKRQIAECKQRGLSMESYYAKLNTLWQELEALDHHHQQQIHCQCKNASEEEEKVHQFLMGLDDTLFRNARLALLAMDPLPSLNQAYSALIQEEDAHNPLLKFPQDIVDEILTRLSPKQLFRLKSVSARCKSMVMDPQFAPKYMTRGSKSSWGMLYPRMENNRVVTPGIPGSGCKEFSYSSSSHHHHPQLLVFYTTYLSPGSRILASNNGFVLSQLASFHATPVSRSIMHASFAELHVCNPLTNRSLHLPRFLPGKERRLWTHGFATRAIGSSSSAYKIEYKVVILARPWSWDSDSSVATIKIFSSSDIQKGWIDVVPEGGGGGGGVISCPPVVFAKFVEGPNFCYKGILHWIDGARRVIVTYDPFDQPGRFGHIPLPNVGSRKEILASMHLFHLNHEESLKCCEIEQSSSVNDDLNLLVWRIVDYGKGEWCLEKRFRIIPLCGGGGGGEGGLLNGCRQVIAPDPEGGFGYVFASDNRVTFVDLGSGEEKDVDISEVFQGPQPYDRLRLLPFVYCPWSLPSPDQRSCLPKLRVSKRKERC